KARLKEGLEAYLAVQQRVPVSERPAGVRMLRRYLPYAAAVLVIALVAFLWLSHRQPKGLVEGGPVIAMQYEIPPGGNRATLTLSDGTVVDLDSARKGVISKQADVNIVKTDSGAIMYRSYHAAGG